jgi:exonuclease VII large subunit
MRVTTGVKKTAARPTVKTLDEAVMLLTTSMAEMSQRIAESDRQMKESNERADRRMVELERQMKESDRQIKESNERTDRMIAESNARMEKLIAEMKETVDKLSENLGHVGNKLGELVELIVIPGMRRAVNAHGHKFTKSIVNKVFYGIGRGGYKEKIAEVDMFLYNGNEAMAAEIKASLSAEDVTRHLERLKRLRMFEKDTNVQNKKLYGAIVGISVDFFARKLALKNGLYVLEIMEEEKRLQTEKPARCRVF